MGAKHKTVVMLQDNKVSGRGPLMKKMDASPEIRSVLATSAATSRTTIGSVCRTVMIKRRKAKTEVLYAE